MESTKKIPVDIADFGSSFVNILDTVFNKCPDGIIFKDKTLRYRAVNSAFCEYYNIEDKSRLIGKKENVYIPREIMKLIRDADREVMESCCPINYVINTESNILLNITTFPVMHNNLFSGLISIIKDITQEEAIKEDFVNKHFEYINSERKLQAQRETFVASLGHDLKNPTIAQIRGLELMLKGSFGEINKEQKEILEMILDSCRYMNGMLASLLTTYKNEGGSVKLHFEEFSLPELVNECVSEMIYVAKDKGVIIEIKDCFNKNSINADRIQIKRVIMNLLSNGIKYAYSNTKLDLKIYNNNSDAFFEFNNQSPYIPEEKQKAIFAQYVSYASAHNELGIGLGLYASKKIIEAHNGSIYVQSYNDNRNSFGFRIPIVRKNELENIIYF